MTINVYSLVILAALAVDFLLGLVSDLLNLRHQSDRVPEEFADVYPPEEYARSQQYLRAATRFGIVRSTFFLFVLLAFWFTGGFAFLDRWCEALPLPSIPRGLGFIGLLLLGRSVLALPFSIYSTFVLEERFGFNRTNGKTFIADRVKGLFLALIIGAPLLSAILWFFQTTGDAAWMYCWAITAGFSLLLHYLAPLWIMPLFNRFTPLGDGPLRTAILAYCDKIDFPVTRLFTVDGSKRSNHSNAYIMGLGRHKRIALFDTLVDHHPVPELLAIVAHEVGHWKLRHIQQGLILGVLHSGIIFFLLSLVLSHQGLFAAFGTHPSIHAGLIFFGLLYAPADLLLSLGMNALSRRNEFAADRFAAVTTERPDDLAAALKKLAADNLGNPTPHPLTVILEYSHPPVLQRIRALTAAKNP